MLAKISAFVIVGTLAMIAQGLPVPSLNLNTSAFVISGEYLQATNNTNGDFINAVTLKSQGFVGKSNFSIVVDVLKNNIWAWVTVNGKLNTTKIA